MATGSLKTILPQQLQQLHQGGQKVELIDVRMPSEYEDVHVEYARNVPLDSLDPREVMAHRLGAPHDPLYVICRSGKRGEMACRKFLDAGLVNVINVEGGTAACEAAGLPVVRGKKAMPLDCQMRIAAGSLVLLGAVLGYFVHPAFIGLSAFVGAGLIYAGVTDNCPMTSLLAKMPWNQVSGKAASCCRS